MKNFQPLDFFSNWLTYKIFAIPQNSSLGKTVDFFILETLKIFILITLFIFSVTYFKSFIAKIKVQKFFNHKKKYVAHGVASIFAIITPFCSCSAVPLFISFIEANIPIGIAFSFLIAAPMINEVALIMLISLFGIKTAFIYFLSGLLISIFAGLFFGKIRAEKWINNDILIKDYKSKKNLHNSSISHGRLLYAKKYTLSILKKISLYIIMGVAIGAWIHGYVSHESITHYVDLTKWFNVPIAVIIGIPFYVNSAGVIPLISSLTEKGLSTGTALAFMMALTGLSLPEFFILKRVMKLKLIILFILIVALGIIFTGYLFNAIL